MGKDKQISDCSFRIVDFNRKVGWFVSNIIKKGAWMLQNRKYKNLSFISSHFRFRFFRGFPQIFGFETKFAGIAASSLLLHHYL
ncbi:MAG: hypothetical protein RIS64_1479 [Bacteroidota bacterium]|jgi:hypothetical protein